MLNKWQWEISYEEDDDGQLGNLPLIHVPPKEQMPRFLLVWEACDTGQFEPGPSGEDLPIVHWDLRQYAQMEVLKSKLSAEAYDDVREALGLEPLTKAAIAGAKISQSVRDKVAEKEMKKSAKGLM